MGLFKHYILTRYNLGVYSPDNPYKSTVGRRYEWMRHRSCLFEKYCLPSILAQTEKNFTWVLAFDIGTPQKYIKPYSLLENIKIIYEQPHLWLRKQKPSAGWLITSRFDNDDKYSTDFVQMVHAAFREKKEVIDIDYDVLDVKTGLTYQSHRRRANSPFLSLSEVWTKEPVTALGRPHSVMCDVYSSRKLNGIHATQIIHDKNVINKTIGGPI